MRQQVIFWKNRRYLLLNMAQVLLGILFFSLFFLCFFFSLSSVKYTVEKYLTFIKDFWAHYAEQKLSEWSGTREGEISAEW